MGCSHRGRGPSGCVVFMLLMTVIGFAISDAIEFHILYQKRLTASYQRQQKEKRRYLLHDNADLSDPG